MPTSRPDDFLRPFIAAEKRYGRRSPGIEWTTANLSWQKCREGICVLLADGYNSTSQDHLTEHYYVKAALGYDVTPFSYAPSVDGVIHHYQPRDTQKRVQISARLLSEYLPLSESATVLPVGLSYGCVVTLLGVSTWIIDSNLPRLALAARIPRIVLVAPALSPTPRLNELYSQEVLAGNLDNVPPCIVQLADTDSPEWHQVQQELVTAFGLIQWAGIDIYVIYWPDDPLCRYPWYPSLQSQANTCINLNPLSPPGLTLPPISDPLYEREGSLRHIEFLRHPRTIGLVQTLLH